MRVRVQAKVHAIVAACRVRLGWVAQSHSDGDICTPAHLLHPFVKIARPTNDPNLLLDATLATETLLGTRSCLSSLALLSGVTVSRRGGFSCPVRAGGILYNVLPTRSEGPVATSNPVATPVEQVCAAAAEARMIAGAPAAMALARCHTFAAVQDAVAAGELPRIVSAEIVRPLQSFVACVVEFEANMSVSNEVRSPPSV
jgi:hypothetical protein